MRLIHLRGLQDQVGLNSMTSASLIDLFVGYINDEKKEYTQLHHKYLARW